MNRDGRQDCEQVARALEIDAPVIFRPASLGTGAMDDQTRIRPLPSRPLFDRRCRPHARDTARSNIGRQILANASSLPRPSLRRERDRPLPCRHNRSRQSGPASSVADRRDLDLVEFVRLDCPHLFQSDQFEEREKSDDDFDPRSHPREKFGKFDRLALRHRLQDAFDLVRNGKILAKNFL